MGHFAWDIRGGDTVYVADAGSRHIVGMGHARAPIGVPAYRFDNRSPITSDTESWCHLIDMDWDETFVPFRYEHPRAPLNVVLKLNQQEFQSFEEAWHAAENGYQSLPLTKEIQTTPLLDSMYTRYSPAARRLIHRRHVTISNSFTFWLGTTFGTEVTQEREQIDATFEIGGRKYLAEFKIAYQDNTKRAIREALGQILEYNHYPPRISHDHWLLILDVTPSKEDIVFISRLRNTFGVPLTLGWQADSAFYFEQPLSF